MNPARSRSGTSRTTPLNASVGIADTTMGLPEGDAVAAVAHGPNVP